MNSRGTVLAAYAAYAAYAIHPLSLIASRRKYEKKEHDYERQSCMVVILFNHTRGGIHEE